MLQEVTNLQSPGGVVDALSAAQRDLETHEEGVRAQALPGRARPVPPKTEAKDDLLICGSEMHPWAHVTNSGSSLQHHSVEPSGSVAWLAEGSLYCPGSSLYPVSWMLLQRVSSSVDGARPNREQNEPLLVFLSGIRSQQREKQRVPRRRISNRKTCLHARVSCNAARNNRDSTAGCPAVKGCMRPQRGRRAGGKHEALPPVCVKHRAAPCHVRGARARRAPKTYAKRLQ